MIISHEYKFIFFHIPKTGGISIDYALEPHLEKNVIIPRHTYDDGLWRHTTARWLKEYFEKHGWDFDDYFKFTFVRNPWERVHSHYYFMRRHVIKKIEEEKTVPEDYDKAKYQWQRNIIWMYKDDPSFKEYMDAMFPFHPGGSTFQHYCKDGNGNDLVDFIGYYEHLDKHFAYVCGRIGLPPLNLEKHNTSKTDSGNKRPPKEQDYTEELIERVRLQEAYDIERFGYCYSP